MLAQYLYEFLIAIPLCQLVQGYSHDGPSPDTTPPLLIRRTRISNYSVYRVGLGFFQLQLKSHVAIYAT